MRLIKRDKSIITGKDNLEIISVIKKFPAVIGISEKSSRMDILSELRIGICRDTGIIQLTLLMPPEIVYSGYHSEALGKVWQKHHAKFANWLTKTKPSSVMEIGGSNGELARLVIKKGNIKNWTIIEPNPAVKTNGKIKVVKKLFDKDFKDKGKYDSIVHSHTLEHAYNPLGFLLKTNEFLGIGGKQVFTVPNLYKYLLNKQSNVINFEHSILLTEELIDNLLKMAGFKILKKKYYEEHSIFYLAEKISEPDRVYKGKNLYPKYKKEFYSYINYYQKLVRRYNSLASSFKGTIYIFGAHVFSQFLISMGLNGNLDGIIDNSQLKHGKRLYGTNYLVYSPDKIKTEKNVAVILNVGQYQKEIEKQLKSINPKVKIWK